MHRQPKRTLFDNPLASKMIEVNALAKRFRMRTGRKGDLQRHKDAREQGDWFHAVRDVSFRCKAGEVLGLLGSNGAGKTTTLRILSTALRADSGSAVIAGVDVGRDPIEARRALGFLSGTTGLYGRLTARENVEYFGRLHGVKEQRLKQRCDELFERLGMHEYAHKRADALSTGMRQKCSIARAVVHEPKVIILDEPTTGLDVMSAKILLDFMAEYKANGVPLIFSTHHLHEVEKLCTSVCVIEAGRTAFSGTPEELRRHGASDNLYDGFVSVVQAGGQHA